GRWQAAAAQWARSRRGTSRLRRGTEEGDMAEVIGEGLEELADRIAQLSERQATNARILLEEIQRRRSEAGEQGRNFSAPNGAQVLDQLLGAHRPSILFGRWPGGISPRRVYRTGCASS